MENQLLATVIASRESYELIKQHISINKNVSREKKYSREFVMLLEMVGDYYTRDPDATHVDTPLLKELISAGTLNDKHAERFSKIVDDALAEDVSTSNVRELVLRMKKNELAVSLAVAIQNEQPHDKILSEYYELNTLSSLEELIDRGTHIYEYQGVDEIIADNERSAGLTVFPKAINDRLEGGVIGSDHIVIFARPETGKTGLILTMACGFARQGAVGIVFSNEESIKRLRRRALCCATGMTAKELYANPEAAKDIADQVGFHNIIFIEMSPGDPNQIEALVKRYNAKWFIVDQLRHINVASENRTTQLEMAANAIRHIGKRNNAVAISVTQAGDSATNKTQLDQGDVDSSNTGIPGACDLMIGIGGTDEQMAAGQRWLSLCKNKLGGEHACFPVRFNPYLSKYVSVTQERGEPE